MILHSWYYKTDAAGNTEQIAFDRGDGLNDGFVFERGSAVVFPEFEALRIINRWNYAAVQTGSGNIFYL